MTQLYYIKESQIELIRSTHYWPVGKDSIELIRSTYYWPVGKDSSATYGTLKVLFITYPELPLSTQTYTHLY